MTTGWAARTTTRPTGKRPGKCCGTGRRWSPGRGRTGRSGRRITWYAANGCGIRQFLDIGTGLPAPATPTRSLRRSRRALPHRVRRQRPAGPVARPRPAHPRPRRRDLWLPRRRRPRPGRAAGQGGRTCWTSPSPSRSGSWRSCNSCPTTPIPPGSWPPLAATLAPGSLIAISHLTADHAPGPVADGAAAYNARVPVPAYPRRCTEVAALFGDLPLQ